MTLAFLFMKPTGAKGTITESLPELLVIATWKTLISMIQQTQCAYAEN